MSKRMKHYRIEVDIEAPSAAAAEELREEIVGAVEDAGERGDDATGLIGALEEVIAEKPAKKPAAAGKSGEK